MNYVEFMKSFEGNKLRGVFLFDSKEKFLSDSIIDLAKDMVGIVDFNLVDIKGEADYDQIKTAIETYPVMEDKKVIIWRDIDLSKNGMKNYKNTLDPLTKDLVTLPDYVIFLIFSNDSPFKGKFYKEVQKSGAIVNIDKLNRKELTSFIGKRFKKAGKKISMGLIDEIIQRFSYLDKNSEVELYELVNTIDKIISNSDEEIVGEKDVREQLNEVLNLNIFNLTDALSNKNAKKAIETFLYMKKTGEDLFMIYHMIIRQVRNMIGIKLLVSKGVNDNFIGKYLKLSPFELRKVKGFVKNFSLDDLFNLHDRLFDMDLKQKTSNLDMGKELILLIGDFVK
ncbi:DNA polymerase III subunit delta [Anaerococcus sp. AGMB09787]|uniref:DNA polymerase III subunit delta n=1 Tax=Anaerococcus sp. AGMB09787 TaxID=2922869 RepID=UPI001FAF3DEC